MDQSGKQSTPAGEDTTFDTKGAWYAVAVLLIAYTFSFIDRTIISLLVGPIKADLDISDTQMGVLMGFAFAIFYTIMGVPIGKLADQYSRRWIITVGVFFWSLMTAACGLSKSFWQLFAARVGVGIGEAALTPAAYSMIADYFHPSKLGRALGIYSSGVFVGAGLAFIIGGYIVNLIANASAVTLPIVGEMALWQLTFIIVGLPGIFVALLTLSVKEPKRRLTEIEQKYSSKVSFSKTLKYIRSHLKTFAGHFIGFSMLALTFNATAAWGPTMFIRKFDWSTADAGYVLGINILIFGTAGIIAGGWFSDRLIQRDCKDATQITGIISALGTAPSIILIGLLPSATLVSICFAFFMFFASFGYGAAAAALQMITPNEMRAQVSALYLFFINLLGLGLGPTAVALLTDYVFKDLQAVGMSIAVTAGVAAVLGGIILQATRKSFKKTYEEIHA